MVDFWLTIGAMIADEELLTAVESLFSKGKLKFKFIPSECIDKDGTKLIRATSGLLDKTSTVNFRDALNNYFAKNYPRFEIPISLYTPAYLCRIANIKNPARHAEFLVQMRNLNKLLLTLAGKQGIPVKAIRSRRFLTLLGAVIIDDSLRTEFDGSKPTSKQVNTSFYLLPNDQETALLPLLARFLEAIAGDPKAFDGRRNSGWDDGCEQLYDWYDGSARAAN